jgi:hypothetical protein
MTRPSTASDLAAKAEDIAAKASTIDVTKILSSSTGIQWPSLAPALVAALADLTIVVAGRTANAGSYSYDYADLADVVKLTRPVLNQHGIVALTPVHDHGTGLACSVILLHASGERMDLGPFPFPHGRDAQATGSMVTYHRRYALVAALGMAAGDDDDGAAAKPRAPEVVWNAGMVKAALVEILGDKAKAREAWTAGGGDELTVFSRAVAQRLADEWDANQPPTELTDNFIDPQEGSAS